MALDGSFCAWASPRGPCDATPSPMYLGTSPQLEPTTALLKTFVTILHVVKQIESKISRIILFCLHITSGGSPSVAPVFYSPPSPCCFSLGTSALAPWHSR